MLKSRYFFHGQFDVGEMIFFLTFYFHFTTTKQREQINDRTETIATTLSLKKETTTTDNTCQESNMYRKMKSFY